MSAEVRVDTTALRRLARNLDDVVTDLRAAQAAVLATGDVQATAFSAAGQPLGLALAAAIEYAGNDAFDHAGQVGSIQARLVSTAETWDATEEASTVEQRPCG